MPLNRVIKDIKVPPHPILADDVVRVVGMPVAAVVADTPAHARDAAQLVEVEYEPLPAVTDAEAALKPGAPLVHPELGTNKALSYASSAGDVRAAFTLAAQIVKLRVAHSRLSGVTLEPRGVLARFDPATQELTVWISTQSPFRVRADLATALNFPEPKLRVIAPEVGGGFGVKGALYREDVVTAFLAMKLGRPVKWVASRSEDLLTTFQGRGAVAEAEMALAKDGRVTGLRVKIVYNLGAHLVLNAAIPPYRHAVLVPGAYRIENVEVESVGALTNTASTGPYRGAGRPEAAYLIERLLDEAARALNLDPAEIRRRNFIKPEEFPYRSPTGLQYDSGEYEKSLDKALGLIDYPRFREEQKSARARGELLGIGLATYIEPTGMGWESGLIRIERNGAVTAITGSSAHGQGHETSFSQIVADALGVHPQEITVRHGDTLGGPPGIGTFGSRSTGLGGGALVKASHEVREKGRRLAAHMLEAAVEDVIAVPGGFHVVGVPERRVKWRQVADLAYKGVELPQGENPGLEATIFFQPGREMFSFGAAVAVVRVDRETGAITIERLVAVDDCGNIINPLLVEGQIHGGLAQGIGQAMLEGIVYDENGQLLTGTLMEYAVPRADDMPPLVVDKTTTPTPLNPLGAKGVGEAGAIAAPPAIVNAVIDALAPLGITHLDMPLTSEKIWHAIHGK
jgi:carbon-monoxide dehydrogenase large subunit